ncbi:MULTISPECIES: hypothetical protein [Bacillus]|uniref:hypothetical protein n=1 Tax=Bacillus TaxID=1386 RepID=UPI000BB99CB3|nr:MULTISPECIES: hypothetical protein [Bacillus]
MNENLIMEILDKLKNGELNEYTVTNDVFMEFRKVLVAREDFKHFRGIAKHNGVVIYKYTESARS